jgi:hypothetical protein
MSEQAAQSAPDVAPLGLVSRFVGIITSPRETFAKVAANPHWLGMMILIVVVTGSLAIWFQSTDVGRQATLDQSVKWMESFGMKLSDKAYDAMQQQIMDAPVWRTALQTGVSLLVFTPVVCLAIAGILFGVFTAALGGGATFKQVMAVIVHAGAISTLGQVFTYPIFYLRESMTSATNLAVLLPMLAEKSFLAKFLGMVDLFTVWWVLVMAIGLAVLYRRKTRPIALSFFAIYGVIAVAIAAFQAMRSGS